MPKGHHRRRRLGLPRGRQADGKAVAIAAGLGDGFRGHSPRVGYTNDLSGNGAGLLGIQQEGRWNDPRQVENYTGGRMPLRGRRPGSRLRGKLWNPEREMRTSDLWRGKSDKTRLSNIPLETGLPASATLAAATANGHHH